MCSSDLLAQLADGDISDGGGVECIAAAFGIDGGMGTAAVKCGAHFGDAHGAGRFGIDACRMQHHGGIKPVKCAVSGHKFFAAATLFGRCAQIAHTTGQTRAQSVQSEAGAQTDGGDDVVAAGMSNAR